MHARCLQVYIKNNPLTLNDGSLYEEANFCPCWSHAQSQLPHFYPPCIAPTTTFFSLSHPHMQKFTIADNINMPESSSEYEQV